MAAPLVSVNPLGRGTLAAAHTQVNRLTFVVTSVVKTLSIYPSMRRPRPSAPPGV